MKFVKFVLYSIYAFYQFIVLVCLIVLSLIQVDIGIIYLWLIAFYLWLIALGGSGIFYYLVFYSLIIFQMDDFLSEEGERKQ